VILNRWWVWAIIAVLICAFVVSIKAILLPFVAGLAIAYLLDPSADRLEKAGTPRWLATIIVLTVFFGGLMGVLLAAAPILKDQIAGIITSLPRYVEQLRPFFLSLVDQAGGAQEAKDLVGQFGGKAVEFATKQIAQVIAGGFAVFNFLTLILIAPVVSFYLLRDWDVLTVRIDKLLPGKFEPTIRKIMQESDTALSGFVRGQLSVCLCMGILYAAGWSLLGLNYGLLLGILAGALAFIPFVGPFFGAALATIVAIGQFAPDYTQIGLVVGVFVVVQIIEGTVLTPNLLGDRVGLHPVWVLFAIFAGGELMGFVGVLLAVPIAAVVAVVGRWLVGRYQRSDLFLQDQEDRADKPAHEESA
jgi:predicted PurR-regulated permease PerM